jgi:hypothetical protein
MLNYYSNYFKVQGIRKDYFLNGKHIYSFLPEGKRVKAFRDVYGKEYAIINTGLPLASNSERIVTGIRKKQLFKANKFILKPGTILVKDNPFAIKNSVTQDKRSIYRGSQKFTWGVKTCAVSLYKREEDNSLYIYDTYYSDAKRFVKGSVLFNFKWLFNDKLLLQSKIKSGLQFYDIMDKNIFMRFKYIIPPYKRRLYKYADAKIYSKMEKLLFFFPKRGVYTLYIRVQKKYLRDRIVTALFFRLVNSMFFLFKRYNLLLLYLMKQGSVNVYVKLKIVYMVIKLFLQDTIYIGIKHHRKYPFGRRVHRLYMNYSWVLYFCIVLFCKMSLKKLCIFSKNEQVSNKFYLYILKKLFYSNFFNVMVPYVSKYLNKQNEVTNYLRTYRLYYSKERLVSNNRVLRLYLTASKMRQRERFPVYFSLTQMQKRSEVNFYSYFFRRNNKSLYFLKYCNNIDFYNKYNGHPYYARLLYDPVFYKFFEKRYFSKNFSKKIFKKNVRSFFKLLNSRPAEKDFTREFVNFWEYRYKYLLYPNHKLNINK